MPIVALINSNNDPENITYPIPCNSSAKLSIEWVLRKLEEAIQKGISEREAIQKTEAIK
jgi:ribosomal protein S2